MVLLIWEAAYRFVHWRDFVFPAPSHVLDAALGLLNIPLHLSDGLPRAVSSAPIYRSPMVGGILSSAVRLGAGFILSIVLGAILGTGLWRWKELDRLLGPLFLGMQTLPSVCWVPLAVLLFGINEQAILFVVVMGSCFAIALSLRDGLRAIPPVYQRAGMMLGAHGWRLYRYVLLPASLPALASSLRQGFSFAWRSLLGAELILVVERHGLGFLLATGRDFNDIAQVVATMAVMVGLGMLADRYAFGILEQRILRRFGLAPRP